MIRQFIKDQLRAQVKKRLLPKYIRLHRKAHAIGSALSHPDPWAVLSLVGFSNFERIPHDPVNLGTTTVPAEEGGRVEATIVRVITDEKGLIVVPPHLLKQLTYRVDRRSLDMNAEPLGPEDFELGLRVPPVSEVAEDLQGIWQSAPDLSKTKT